jgi:hypothetical protein
VLSIYFDTKVNVSKICFGISFSLKSMPYSKTKTHRFRFDLSAEKQIIPVVRGTPPINRSIALFPSYCVMEIIYFYIKVVFMFDNNCRLVFLCTFLFSNSKVEVKHFCYIKHNFHSVKCYRKCRVYNFILYAAVTVHVIKGKI